MDFVTKSFFKSVGREIKYSLTATVNPISLYAYFDSFVLWLHTRAPTRCLCPHLFIISRFQTMLYIFIIHYHLTHSLHTLHPIQDNTEFHYWWVTLVEKIWQLLLLIVWIMYKSLLVYNKFWIDYSYLLGYDMCLLKEFCMDFILDKRLLSFFFSLQERGSGWVWSWSFLCKNNWVHFFFFFVSLF